MFPMLKKNVNRSISAGSPGVPGRPGTPYTPARTVTVTEERCSLMPDGWSWVLVESETGSFVNGEPQTQMVLVLAPDDPNCRSGCVTSYSYRCQEVTYTRFIPEKKAVPGTPGIPPVPSQLRINYKLGWNENAISRKRVARGGGVRFSVPKSVVGVTLGLAFDHHDSGRRHIAFGFYFTSGIARIYESGEEVVNLGQYQGDDRFEVVRYAGQIWYSKNGELVHQRDNTDEELGVSVSLYSGDDSVNTPEMVYTADSETEMYALRGSSRGMERTTECPEPDTETSATLQALCGLSWGSGASATRVNVSLPYLVGRSHPATRVHGQLPIMMGLASENEYSKSHVTLGKLTGHSGYEEDAPSYCIADGILQYMGSSSSSSTGQIASADVQMQTLLGISSEGEYSRADTAMPVDFFSRSRMLHDHEVMSAVMVSMGYGSLDLLHNTHIAVVMHSESEAVSVFTFDTYLAVKMFSQSQAGATMSASHIMQTLMMSATSASPLMDTKDAEVEVWVANLKNSAFSRYQHFEFNSYAKVQGKYYGAKSDGIYLLEGDTDAGNPVNASVRLGRTSFGTSVNKSMPGCYLGVSSSGKMYVKVTANGKTYSYAARAYSQDMQTQRVDTGKGLRATHYELEIANKNGDQFELENVEFIAVPLTRRV